ncbi:hypothetical protein BJ508DRAFT_414701 [Ascobolus immersus RN42]|uniref:LysM domain-containing protein n=1 Tax=Ascobolus immersus RN42 TaxID=1160509 RepID=A0A3N4I5T8_ASCIM|nr:hypothetical protein BJ508DRAFT_414701 [Ascobolus immersus RN42]
MKFSSITDTPTSSLFVALSLLLQALPTTALTLPPYVLGSNDNPKLSDNTCAYVQTLHKRSTPHKPTKRAYTAGWGTYSRTSLYTSRFGAVFPEWRCFPDNIVYERTITSWPGGNRSLFGSTSPLQICSTKVVACTGANQNDPDDQELHESCPANDDELINKLVEQGKSWEPPLSREEVVCGLDYLNRENAPAVYGKPVSASLSVIMTPPPGPTQGGVYGGCQKWVVAKKDDSCYWIAENNGVGLGRFYERNPAVQEGGECRQLWIGYAYCVGGPGY